MEGAALGDGAGEPLDFDANRSLRTDADESAGVAEGTDEKGAAAASEVVLFAARRSLKLNGAGRSEIAEVWC